jgi:hypothetical protein
MVAGLMPDRWEELTQIGHDSYLGFGDASTSPEVYYGLFQNCTVNGRVLDCTSSGHSAIACFTEADDPVPVEVQLDAAGDVYKARLCWTNDVDDLDGTEGEWRKVGASRSRAETASPGILITT